MDTNNRFTKEKEQELIERLKEPYIYYADYRDQIEDTFIKELAKDIENDPNTPPLTLFKKNMGMLRRRGISGTAKLRSRHRTRL